MLHNSEGDCWRESRNAILQLPQLLGDLRIRLAFQQIALRTSRQGSDNLRIFANDGADDTHKVWLLLFRIADNVQARTVWQTQINQSHLPRGIIYGAMGLFHIANGSYLDMSECCGGNCFQS
jgi:hypothetical protein